MDYFAGPSARSLKSRPMANATPVLCQTNHRVDSLQKGIVSFGYALIVKFKTFACVESVVTVGRK